MNNINRAAAAGVIFFMVILAGFVGIKVDQTTIALLGGAFIGLVIAIPTTALIMVIGLRKPVEQAPQAPQAPPVFPQQQLPTTTHYHTHNNTINVYVSRDDLSPFDKCTEVANALRISRYRAERMIEAGEVQCLPAGR